MRNQKYVSTKYWILKNMSGHLLTDLKAISMLQYKSKSKNQMSPQEHLLYHRAQTMLYTLMMSDRYDVDVKCGMLYYVDAKESIRVRALRNEVRGLIMGRNELARWIKARNGLPEMIRSERDCKHCYAADSCLVYHKVVTRHWIG